MPQKNSHQITCGALVSALGLLTLLFAGDRSVAALGALLSITAILMLFFGQRMAKDYTGAAALIPYFILASSALCLMGIP